MDKAIFRILVNWNRAVKLIVLISVLAPVSSKITFAGGNVGSPRLPKFERKMNSIEKRASNLQKAHPFIKKPGISMAGTVMPGDQRINTIHTKAKSVSNSIAVAREAHKNGNIEEARRQFKLANESLGQAKTVQAQHMKEDAAYLNRTHQYDKEYYRKNPIQAEHSRAWLKTQDTVQKQSQKADGLLQKAQLEREQGNHGKANRLQDQAGKSIDRAYQEAEKRGTYDRTPYHPAPAAPESLGR